ncbi:hypothetical protein [Salipiger abyssi]|uniref:Uncharacterized protein n=1 Tax=Salipiger abyssi TaxID=1250539 RepID=A0A1P8UP86_9RHOB|nr:hypothetical protein [Salipiger abyssi]APZ51219.1 hypothetical protein Ga0080574_TMP885 [Salipiger abyssi]
MNDEPKMSAYEVHAVVQGADLDAKRIVSLEAQVVALETRLAALEGVMEAKADVSALESVADNLDALSAELTDR